MIWMMQMIVADWVVVMVMIMIMMIAVAVVVVAVMIAPRRGKITRRRNCSMLKDSMFWRKKY